jgi:hypothetical protein
MSEINNSKNSLKITCRNREIRSLKSTEKSSWCRTTSCQNWRLWSTSLNNLQTNWAFRHEVHNSTRWRICCRKRSKWRLRTRTRFRWQGKAVHRFRIKKQKQQNESHKRVHSWQELGWVKWLRRKWGSKRKRRRYYRGTFTVSWR